jgi:hypothetical protein
MLQLAHDLRFFQETPGDIRFAPVFAQQHLDGEAALEGSVVRPQHHADAAVGDFAFEVVTPDLGR